MVRLAQSAHRSGGLRSIRPIRAAVLAAALVAALTAGGCGDRARPREEGPRVETPASGISSDYARRLVQMRRQKDSAFRGADSPIPEQARSTFPGLDYYPPDERLALQAELVPFPHPEKVQVMATKGDVRWMHRIGRLRFTIDGASHELTAYKHAIDQPYLFVPFADATNGTETYDVGRYIDLEERPDGRYPLDFNQAYNPYCAYDKSYTCPIVPEENVLTIPIRAGERLPSWLPRDSAR